MAGMFDPSALQPNQYGVLVLGTLFWLSQASAGLSEAGIGHYQMAFIALAVWYGPSVIKEDVIQKYGSLAILVGMMSLSGPWKLPLGDFAQPYHLHSILLALLVHYAPAVFHQHFMGTQNKYVLLALAYLLAPSSSGTGALFEPYLQLFVVAAGLFIALVFISTNLHGPLLWAYPERKDLFERAKKMIPPWARFLGLTLLFHPWTRWWLIPFILATAWQYLRFYHHTTSQSLLTRARSAAAGATAHASRLQAEATSLERLSLQAHTLATTIGRDALTAHHIRLTDFYTESTHAWAKLGDFRNAIDSVTADSDKLFLRTDDLRKKVPLVPQTDRDAADRAMQMANSVYEASKAIAREGHEFRQAAKRIQAKTERFARAARLADSSRTAQAAAATAAAACAKNIASAAIATWKDAWDAEGVAEKLRGKVGLVEDAAAAGNRAGAEGTVGEMERARPPAESATVIIAGRLLAAKQSAEAEMQNLYTFQFPAAPPKPADELDVEEEID
ncbi:MAG: hypothetical protein M1840_009118 [Geoglossum simile]|nr:MAG: hypothetical protein M1840_009118 [Geoglossum simile]